MHKQLRNSKVNYPKLIMRICEILVDDEHLLVKEIA